MAGRDPLFEPWAAATIGDPVLVRTVEGEPSYWLVPVELGGRAIGFVRVTGNGRVAAAGVHYRDAQSLVDSPRLVTGIGADEAVEQARAHLAGTAARVMADPVFVHEGPPGREAWRVLVEVGDGSARTLFVTSGGVYER
ncbi:MAG: hypothetical protein ACR2KK_09085 [Acidimicrobiales bacterium]